VQFSSSLERQVMINLSPIQLDDVREIVIVEHDRGLNFRSCPFTRTCWIMFLAFPLDFQTRDIISQAVGLFGSVKNWIDNSRCRSRILLRCNVTLVSRIPRSIIISEGIRWVIMEIARLSQFLFYPVTKMMWLLGTRIPSQPMAIPTLKLVSPRTIWTTILFRRMITKFKAILKMLVI
jgi:hypothetical protein